MKTRKSGTAATEFVLTFPVFLVVCLLAVEMSLISLDRHVMNLAAFEAARVFASAPPTIFSRGPEGIVSTIDPCNAPDLRKKARGAAIAKMSIIAMPIGLFVKKLGSVGSISLPQLPDTSVNGLLLRGAQRLLTRWPVAAAMTRVGCQFNAATDSIKVELTYHRVGQTPVVDRLMWMLYQLSHMQLGQVVSLDVDQDFYGVEVRSPLTESLRRRIRESLALVNQGQSTIDSISPMLQQILGQFPEMASVFSALPAVSSLAEGAAGFLTATDQQIGGSVGSATDATARVLTTVFLAIPESFRTIPIRTDVTLARTLHSHQAQSQDGSLSEVGWEGRMSFLIALRGEYRDFAKVFSRPVTPLEASR